MSFMVQYCRLTTADKLPDRFLTTQVYNPSDSKQASQGIIFSQVEIMNPWFPTSQIGQTIINTVIREYYRGTNTSELINFENALKRVNQTLAQITQNGETDWIGNLNGVIILINGKEVHFAQTGKSQAYLFRAGKINHITEGLAQATEPHPLKTFSNITSGSLQLHDKLLIANSILFDHLSLEDIRNLVSSNPPAQATLELARALKASRIRTANSLIAELVTPEDITTLPKEQKIETVYLDQKLESPATIGRRWYSSYLIPSLASAGRGITRAGRWTADKFKTVVIPGSKQAASGLSKVTQTGFARLKRKSPNLQSPIPPTVTEPPKATSPETPITSAKPAPKGKLGSIMATIGQSISGFFRWLRPIVGLDNDPRHRRRRYITAAIILLLILGLTIIISRATNPGLTAKEAKAKLAVLQEKKSEADIKVNFNDRGPAITLYAEVIDGVGELTNHPAVTQDAKQLESSVQVKLDELTGSQRLAPANTLAQVADTRAIYDLNGSLWAIVKNGSITKIQNPGGQTSQVAGLPNTAGDYLASSPLPESKKIALLSASPTVYLFDTTDQTVSPAPGNSTWVKSVDIAGFFENLYLLSPAENQIYKYPFEDKSYEPGQKFVKSGNLSNAISLAIDGVIYTLKNDSIVTIFDRGEPKELKLDPAPYLAKGLQPKKIITAADSSSLFILYINPGHDSALLEYSKSGKFLKQYILTGASADIVNLDLEPKGRTLWTVNAKGEIAQLKLT